MSKSCLDNRRENFPLPNYPTNLQLAETVPIAHLLQRERVSLSAAGPENVNFRAVFAGYHFRNALDQAIHQHAEADQRHTQRGSKFACPFCFHAWHAREVLAVFTSIMRCQLIDKRGRLNLADELTTETGKLYKFMAADQRAIMLGEVFVHRLHAVIAAHHERCDCEFCADARTAAYVLDLCCNELRRAEGNDMLSSRRRRAGRAIR